MRLYTFSLVHWFEHEPISCELRDNPRYTLVYIYLFHKYIRLYFGWPALTTITHRPWATTYNALQFTADHLQVEVKFGKMQKKGDKSMTRNLFQFLIFHFYRMTCNTANFKMIRLKLSYHINVFDLTFRHTPMIK